MSDEHGIVTTSQLRPTTNGKRGLAYQFDITFVPSREEVYGPGGIDEGMIVRFYHLFS